MQCNIRAIFAEKIKTVYAYKCSNNKTESCSIGLLFDIQICTQISIIGIWIKLRCKSYVSAFVSDMHVRYLANE